jgi:hypothetical protein
MEHIFLNIGIKVEVFSIYCQSSLTYHPRAIATKAEDNAQSSSGGTETQRMTYTDMDWLKEAWCDEFAGHKLN